jgi:hypothetical protein
MWIYLMIALPETAMSTDRSTAIKVSYKAMQGYQQAAGVG